MIQRCGNEVREEIGLAKARADFQDQELQKKEREAASGHRRKLNRKTSVGQVWTFLHFSQSVTHRT